MKMKKILSCLGCAALVATAGVALAACGGPKTVEVKTYDELVSALNGKAATIKVVENIDITNQLVVGRKVTLDLNGKTLSNSADIWDKDGDKSNWSLISVQGNGNLTISGEGNMLAKANDCYVIDVRDTGAKVTIENGTFNGNLHTIYVNKGELVVNGGTFDLQQVDSKKGKEFMLNCLDANYTAGTAKITVYGGTFKGFNPEANAAESVEKTTNFVAKGYVAVEGTGEQAGYWTVSKAQA